MNNIGDWAANFELFANHSSSFAAILSFSISHVILIHSSTN